MAGASTKLGRGRGQYRAPRWAALVAGLVVLLACGDRTPADTAELAAPASDSALADAMVTSGASARRVADHALTLDNVERWFEADEALDALAEDDPEVARQLADRLGLRRGDDPIEGAAAHLAAVPGVRETLDEAGTTPYEFVLTGLALHQALLATDPGSPRTLRRLAARNSRFVEQHADVLARYVERPPRYLATYESEPSDDMTDSVAWLDSAAAAGDVALDSAYAVDTLSATPLTTPLPLDTAVTPALPPDAPAVPVPAPVESVPPRSMPARPLPTEVPVPPAPPPGSTTVPRSSPTLPPSSTTPAPPPDGPSGGPAAG
ncbi:MAG TPA: hypothetical protein VFS08_01400 [Gemmatimonadaceae bacterium]|nr:hypothetical protein [Gemmatimonadaceae bacterium]